MFATFYKDPIEIKNIEMFWYGTSQENPLPCWTSQSLPFLDVSVYLFGVDLFIYLNIFKQGLTFLFCIPKVIVLEMGNQ